MKCPACSVENEKGNRFCAMCGSKLQSTCPKCGVPSDPKLKFCGMCGARLGNMGDGPQEQRHSPEVSVVPAEEWVSDFRAIGWGSDTFDNSIRKDLSESIRRRDGEGIVFAGRSSLDLHVFLQGFDASILRPVAGFMGTNQRLVIFALNRDSQKLHPVLQVDYGELTEAKELNGAEATKDMRELDGLLRLSLRGKDKPLDLLVLNKKARTPLSRFLQLASSKTIAAPTDLQQATAQPLAPEGEPRKAQDAAKVTGQGRPQVRKTPGLVNEDPSSRLGQGFSGMKLAATILGIIGGIAGAIGAVAAIVVGGIGAAFGAEGGSLINAFGYVALILAIVGTVGGALAIPKTKSAGVLMLISGLGGIITVSWAYAFGGVLLIAGGILALVALRKPRSVEVKA